MYRFLRITQEKTFGVYDAAGDYRYIRMDKPNVFKRMTKMKFIDLPDPLINAPLLRIPMSMSVLGKLTACIYVEDAPILVGLGGVRIDANAGTTPWATLSSLKNDLASATFDFGYSLHDGTIKRKRYLGVKAVRSKYYCTNGEDARLMCDLDLVGATPQSNPWDASSDPTAMVFPEPAYSDYSVNPYLIYHLGISVAAGARAHAKQWQTSVENMAKPYYDLSRFAQRITCRGRKVTWGADFLHDATGSADIAHAEAVTALGAGTATFTNGGNSLLFDYKAQSHVDTIEDDMPMDEDAYYSLESTAMVDTSGTAVDLAITIV